MTSPVTSKSAPRPSRVGDIEQTGGNTTDAETRAAFLDQMISQTTDQATKDEQKRHDKATKTLKEHKDEAKEEDEEEE